MGLSVITDADGTVLAGFDDEEAVIVADVHLDSTNKKAEKPKCYGKMWAMPVPWCAFIWPMTEKTGKKRYEKGKAGSLKAKLKSGA